MNAEMVLPALRDKPRESLEISAVGRRLVGVVAWP
jgi:hypothetical protein